MPLKDQVEKCPLRGIPVLASHNEREVLFVFAVIKTGGKQYKVSEGDVIFVEKLDVEEGANVSFDEVLALATENDVQVGTPTISGAVVTGKVLKNGKAKKVDVMTYKPKKNEKKKYGHRQPYTKVQIESIG